MSAHFFPSTYYIQNGVSFFELSFFNALLLKKVIKVASNFSKGDHAYSLSNGKLVAIKERVT